MLASVDFSSFGESRSQGDGIINQFELLNRCGYVIKVANIDGWIKSSAKNFSTTNTNNQDHQESIKELKGKADELKGVKEELKTLQRRTYDGELTNVEQNREVSRYTSTWMELRRRLRVVCFGSARAYVGYSKVGNGETASTCPVDDYMRIVRDALNAKRYEMDSVLPVIASD
ncbi:hypothetical protein GIB67_021109 [Kingdonia uniflora]|uniref:Uncharacterized protein n=1 Tax=Kingdonia uniflora TaxID=39325 RepID=A0A7J7N7F6_9MAGN|nr:hypothetical protein GIB67_021109 [Kingdonia uniflora]